jgi:preprotein translocase subunit SecA
LTRRRERLNSQVARDIDVLLQRENTTDDAGKLRLLLTLSQGTRAMFDQRTHKQVKQNYTRFAYVFLAAQLLDGKEAEDISEDVMEHLNTAEETLRATWGQSEYARLNQNASRLADFGPAARIAFGEERLGEAPSSLNEADRARLVDEIGRYVLNEVHRQLLLGAFSELWVEYLTKVEALRVSIGLEAYAQRDPLVQYKSRAAELYQNLQRDIRMGVVTRMFTYRPRDLSQVQVAVARAEAPALQAQISEAPALEAEVEPEGTAEEGSPEIGEAVAVQGEKPAALERNSGKKRKRHRR